MPHFIFAIIEVQCCLHPIHANPKLDIWKARICFLRSKVRGQLTRLALAKWCVPESPLYSTLSIALWVQCVQIVLEYFQCFSSPVNFAFGTSILPVCFFSSFNFVFLVQKLICWPGLWFLLPYIHTSQPCFSITLIEDVDLIFRKTKWTASMFHLQHASITLEITFTPSFSHQVYWIWFSYFGWTSQSAFIAFKSSPCTHFNAFFCLQDTILSLIDLSIADL